MALVGGEVGEGKSDRLLPARQHRSLSLPHTPSDLIIHVHFCKHPRIPSLLGSLT